MPITWNDFDKIWAVSSPLTPYTFSDLNYAAGWDFIGSTPPARQMWDSLQKANDEKFKFLRDNFGTPNMVTTAAQMTDTNKIYVYVGSEAGWNNGHWYYYDAGTSAWVDGGVYNSTAFVTDTTLTEAGKAADAKAVGDALALKADLAGATFTGNVAVNADFSTTGDATITNDLTVSGATALTGNVTASGNVSVVGDIDADNITLTGDISATDVTASGDVTAGALSVSGATTLTGNVTAGADITASGDVTANDASFANATLSGTLSVTGATTLDGLTAGSVSAQSLNTAGNASVGGTLTVSGATTLADITAGDITADDITATGDISADDINASTLTVSGASTLTGNITAGADITVTGDLSVNDITASGDITADDVTANGNLSVVGNATLSGVSTAVTPAEDDNSTNIATTAYVQTEIKPIETDITINDKRISNIEKLLQGNLYDYQTDTDSKYTKTVPQGAMPYASLDSIGGKTLVWNQLQANTLSRTSGGVVFTFDSTDGSLTLSEETPGATRASTAYWLPNENQYKYNLFAGHKYYAKTVNTHTGVQWLLQGNAVNSIITYPSTTMGSMYCAVSPSADLSTPVKFYPQVFDLTLMYGSGNEPTTVAEFQQMFPASYYPYNAGTLLSAGVTEVKSVGVNLFDPNAITDNAYLSTTTGLPEPNNQYCVTDYIPVNAGQTICIPVTYTARRWFYDVDKNPVEYLNNSNEQYYVPTRSGYIRVSINKTSVDLSTVIIAHSTTKPTYVPYNGHTYPIPASIQALEGYGWSAGSVFNYIDYENKKFVKCVGSVDLGSLNWTYDSENTRFINTSIASSIKKPASNADKANIICAKYNAGIFTTYVDKEIAVAGTGNLFVKDSDYTTANSFATANNGTYLYYELATPQEIDISAYLTDDNLISVESGGTLTFPNSNGDDYRIPIPSTETYMVDLQSAI